MKLSINIGNISQAVNLESQIPEFDRPHSIEDIEKRLADKTSLILIAYIDDKPCGYSISYGISSDTLHCWVAGILPEFRRQGVYQSLSKARQQWAMDNGFKVIQLKTKNTFKGMLSFLINDQWLLAHIDDNEDIYNRKITAIKYIK